MNREVSIAISLLVFGIGLSGNLISIVIFKTTELKKHSATLYLTINSLLNITLVAILPFAIIPSFMNINDTNCRIYSSLLILIPEVQGWVLSFCSLDRLAFILRPKKFLFKDKLKFKLIVCLVITVIISLLLIPNFMYYKSGFNSNNETVCLFFDFDWILIYFKFQFIFFRTLIPFVVMVFSSIVISWKMHKMSFSLNKYNPNNSRKNKDFSRTLVVMDIFFIIFRLPMCIYIVTTSNSSNIIYNFIFNLTFLIGCLYNSFYFLILFAFNKLYRSSICEYFDICCKRKYSSTVDQYNQ